MARSFYDDASNQRVTDVIQDPKKASLLRPESGHHNSNMHRGHEVNRAAVLQDSEAMHTVRTAAEEALTMALKFVFEKYNRWEGGVNCSRMDKMRFHKVFRYALWSPPCFWHAFTLLGWHEVLYPNVLGC